MMKALAAVLLLAPAAQAAELVSAHDAARVLNKFRGDGPRVELGGRPHRVAVQVGRTGEMQVTVVAEGGNVHAPAAAYQLESLADWKPVPGAFVRAYDADHALTLEFAADPAGPRSAKLDVEDVKKALFESAEKIAFMAPEWRFIYQQDLFFGAGRPSLVFLRSTPEGVYLFLFPADGLDERPRRLKLQEGASVTVTVEKGRFLFRPDAG